MEKDKLNSIKDIDDFCKCKNSSGVYTNTGSWGHWDICLDCNKVIEDSFSYYNHYDGEDHDDIY